MENNREWLLENFSLVDDGTIDTIIRCNDTEVEFRFPAEYAVDYRDEETGELDLEAFLELVWECDIIHNVNEDEEYKLFFDCSC